MEVAVKQEKAAQLVPKLRFPDFIEEWQNSKLNNLTELLRCGIAATPEYVDEGVPFLSAQNVSSQGEISLHKYSLISESYYKVLSKNHKLLKGDILYSRVGAGYGNAAIFPYNGEFGVYVSLTHIRTNRIILNSFLRFYLNSNYGKKQARKGVFQGGGVPNLNVKIVEKFKIYYPTKPEQQKIASFLSAVDTKIQQLQCKKELLEQYKKGVMQQIFSQEIRFTSTSLSDRNDELLDDNKVVERSRNYPDWEEKRLGDVLTFISTNSFSRNDLNYEAGEIYNIHYGDIHTKFKSNFNLSNEKVPFINSNISLSKISDEQLCKLGDVVIADASEDYNDIGKTIEIIDINNQKIVAGLHTFLGRDLENSTVIGFKCYLFQADYIRKQIMRIAQGVSVLGISKKNLSKISFELPCKEEQQKIADFLSAIDDKIDKTVEQIESTQKFKKGLLQQMFV